MCVEVEDAKQPKRATVAMDSVLKETDESMTSGDNFQVEVVYESCRWLKMYLFEGYTVVYSGHEE